MINLSHTHSLEILAHDNIQMVDGDRAVLWPQPPVGGAILRPQYVHRITHTQLAAVHARKPDERLEFPGLDLRAGRRGCGAAVNGCACGRLGGV